MIIEHEVIEQTENNPNGRYLLWICDLIRDLVRPDPLIVVQAMVRAGYLTLADSNGALPAWRCAEPFRLGSESEAIRVHATTLGSRWVHG